MGVFSYFVQKQMLVEYVGQHATLLRTPAPGAVDVVFFHVATDASASAHELHQRIVAFADAGTVQPFSGNEYSYVELGAWLDNDEELALLLMGMGAHLGLWRLRTPRSVLGAALTDEQVRELAEGGALAITADGVTPDIGPLLTHAAPANARYDFD